MSRYLSVNILRPDYGDCSNNGVSSPARAEDKLFVVACDSGNWSDEDIAANPERFVVLDVVSRNCFSGDAAPYLNLTPRGDEGKWKMFGGNYATTSDSRFCAISRYPLPIHDRIEG